MIILMTAIILQSDRPEKAIALGGFELVLESIMLYLLKVTLG